MPHKYSDRDWHDVSTKVKDPRFPRQHQKLEEARQDLSLQVSEGAWPCPHLGFGLLASRLWEKSLLWSSHPVNGTLLTDPPENEHNKELEKTATQVRVNQYYQKKQSTLRIGLLAQWRLAHCSWDTQREQPTVAGSSYYHIMTGAQLGKRTLTTNGRKRPSGPVSQLPCPARPLSWYNQTAPAEGECWSPYS